MPRIEVKKNLFAFQFFLVFICVRFPYFCGTGINGGASFRGWRYQALLCFFSWETTDFFQRQTVYAETHKFFNPRCESPNLKSSET